MTEVKVSMLQDYFPQMIFLVIACGVLVTGKYLITKLINDLERNTVKYRMEGVYGA